MHVPPFPFTALFTLPLLSVILACSSPATKLPGYLHKKVVCPLPSELRFSTEKIKVVGIFSTWDVKSQVQMGRISKVYPFFRKRMGVGYVFIDNDSRMVDGWVESYKPEFPVLYNRKFKLCGNIVNRVPVTLIVGRSGRICYSYQGTVTSKVLHAQIEHALKYCK